MAYLQPYPDRLLDEIPAHGEDPGDAVVAKETIELAFLVAVQHLPPRQRAVLVLRDVLGRSASETAATLDVGVASANSAPQRARTAMREHLPDRRLDWSSSTHRLSGEERRTLQRYMDAHARGDVEGLTAVLREDLHLAMPPQPGSWVGRDLIVQTWVDGGFGSASFGEWRCVLTRANRQPAVASYLRRPNDTRFRAFALDVLRIEAGLVTQITAFPVESCQGFDLPPTLDDTNTDSPPDEDPDDRRVSPTRLPARDRQHLLRLPGHLVDQGGGQALEGRRWWRAEQRGDPLGHAWAHPAGRQPDRLQHPASAGPAAIADPARVTTRIRASGKVRGTAAADRGGA